MGRLLWVKDIPSRGFYWVVVLGTMGGLRHGNAATALRAAPTERGVYTRLMRLCSLCTGTKAGTKLVLCHRPCVLCSSLVMPRWRVRRGRGVLCHRSKAA